MFIHNLKIKNFKNIKEVDLDFDKITLLSGDTGSGKTAVIEALTLLKTNYLQDKMNEYIRWDNKSFQIEDSFSHLGKDFNYKIDVAKGTNRLLSIDGEEYKNSEAVSKLDEIVNSKLTLFSNISMQGKASELLFETPAPRLKKIKQIFNIDRLQLAIDKMKEDLDANKEIVTQLEADIKAVSNIEFNFLDDVELPDIDKNLVELEIKNLELQQESNKKQEELYNTFVKDKERYIEAQNNISNLTTLILKYKLEIQELQTQLEEEIDFDSKKYQEIVNSINDCNTQIAGYKKLKELEVEQSELVLKRTGRLSEADIQLKIKELNSSILSDRSQVEELNKSIGLVRAGKCPTCKQDYKSDMPLSEIEEKVVSLNTNITDYNNQILTFEKTLTEVQQVTFDNKIVEEKKKTIQTDIDKYKSLLKENEEYYVNLFNLFTKEKQSLEKTNEDSSRIKKHNESIKSDIATKEKEVAVLESKLKDLESTVNPVEVEKPVDFDITKLISLKDSLSDYIALLRDQENIDNHNNKIRKQREDNLLKISEYEKTLYEIRNNSQTLKTCHKILDKDFSSYLIDKGTNYIKGKMNEFFQKSYGKYFIEFKQDSSGIEFFYSEDGSNLHPVSMLSGFEKQIFSVSFRLALCSLQNLNFLLLDEVDSDSSSDKSLQMFKTILEEEWIEQLFVISHKEDTKDFLSLLPNSKSFEFKDGELIN